MIRSFFVCFVVLLTTGPLFGQSLDLHVRKATLDARDVLTLDLVQYAAGSDGRVALEPSLLTLTIDGKAVPITSIVCPEPSSPVDLSSVLTIDISGSMVRGGPNITLARSAAYAWIRALSAGSDCAVTAFDHKASLVSDFTSDTAALMKAIAALTPRGGTDYDAGLLTDEIGGLSMAATGRGKRVLVFLTDGIGTANTSYMIEQARLNGITVYCVSLGMSMPESLRTLSEESGGLWFENVTTVEQAEMAYRRIHADAASPLSCSAKAELPPSCSKERVLVLSSSKESIRRIIATPDSSVTQASIKPLSLRFEKGAPQRRISIRWINATHPYWRQGHIFVTRASDERRSRDRVSDRDRRIRLSDVHRCERTSRQHLRSWTHSILGNTLPLTHCLHKLRKARWEAS
ncbi:MAG: VWA domain-containing protein [Ignavibacteria bacterium]|nr:VWA domain-containing protein [Ignavibacteria bacterium]